MSCGLRLYQEGDGVCEEEGKCNSVLVSRSCGLGTGQGGCEFLELCLCEIRSVFLCEVL